MLSSVRATAELENAKTEAQTAAYAEALRGFTENDFLEFIGSPMFDCF
jgi:hypothetical protein